VTSRPIVDVVAIVAGQVQDAVAAESICVVRMQFAQMMLPAAMFTQGERFTPRWICRVEAVKPRRAASSMSRPARRLRSRR